MSKSAHRIDVDAIHDANADASLASAATIAKRLKGQKTPSQNKDNVTKLVPASNGQTFQPGVVHQVPFADLVIEPGYNVRTFNPELKEHRALAESIRLLGVETPLTIRLSNGKPVVVAGHLRVGACEWLARDGGGKKTFIPSVPVLLREDLTDSHKRTRDLAVSNSAIKLTMMQKAETAHRMNEEEYSLAAIGTHLGDIGTKWVQNLLALYEVRDTALADMIQQDHIAATFAFDLMNTHGKETAVSIAVAVFAEEESRAKYGSKPKVTKSRVDAYLAKLAKMEADKPDTGASEQAGASETKREPSTPLATAQAAVAAAKAELALAEARRKGARGGSVKKATRELESAVATLTAAEAEVARLEAEIKAEVDAKAAAVAKIEAESRAKRGPTERTGENAEKTADKAAAPARDPNAPLMFRREGARIVWNKTDRSGKVAATMGEKEITFTHSGLASWVEALMNEHADSMPPLN